MATFGAVPRAVLRGFARFRHDRRGGVAVWFGVGAVALLFFAGSGLDLARGINQQAEIQGAADAAALAGAGAYTSPDTLAAATAAANNYMAQFKTASGLTDLTFTVTPGTVSSGSGVAVYKMTVKASGTIANTLMAMASKSTTVAVTATAQNPVYNITITMAGFSSSAVDTNTVSYYTVPADGSVPTTTALLYSNAKNSTATAGSRVVQLTASQKLGFMLTNTTDGNAATTCTTVLFIFQNCSSNSYGNNAYGGQPNSVHYFYSHLFPPSKLAYPSVTQNCSLRVLVGTGSSPSTGCSAALPTYATVNCVNASGLTLSYYWNDMGGSTDDKDYNDAVYTVACSQVGTSTSKGLVLTN
ncbi:TadE/TadG family type IV pilus assembly protein [Lichenibacterium ramalinae]|uniref:Putative Flp pilus-assembly TadG-like N-terminal domain-containing protein n=1 Tax=Lichenibacterium ramalinae TaxID=2316527 RepID=A0A4Q2R858_9HYPH|nr:pilus assembly protein TadG-related protein [Lichenibacterium ramalinae]RYB01694.1 hypothetical protein D3272_24885 [Lichenibacterium ramalinae]